MLKKLSLILGVLIFSQSIRAYEVNHCAQFDADPEMSRLLYSLSEKLSYSYEELCSEPRIFDIFSERRQVYYLESDSYHEHMFITLHYNEYSCEYQFDMVMDQWADQHCYSTF